jgi:hypothetical protein
MPANAGGATARIDQRGAHVPVGDLVDLPISLSAIRPPPRIADKDVRQYKGLEDVPIPQERNTL